MKLSRRQRTTRITVGLAALLALVAGTFWGDDEHFPFGPFRMYSVRNDPNGTIKATRLRGTSVDGRELRLPFLEAFGVRRPEVDRQLWRFSDDDRVAELLMESYKNKGSRPPLRELLIIRDVYQLEDGRPVSSFETLMGSWRLGD